MSTSTQSLTLRIGAALAVLGAAATAVSGVLHPAQQPPDDHPRVFAEYAQSDVWVTGHLIQTYGFFFTFLALAALGLVLATRGGRTQVLAQFGLVLATAAMAAAAILQGLDAVARKAVTLKWSAAPETDRASAFAAAEAVRYLEIGFNSIFRMLQGSCLAIFGAALVGSPHWSRWLGWSALLLGAVIIVRGFAVAYTGFSLANPLYAQSGAVALHLLNVWLLALAVYMWRASSSVAAPDARPRQVARHGG